MMPRFGVNTIHIYENLIKYHKLVMRPGMLISVSNTYMTAGWKFSVKHEIICIILKIRILPSTCTCLVPGVENINSVALGVLTHPGRVTHICVSKHWHYHTPRTTKLLGNILVSPRPSVCPSVRLSVRPSVRPASRVRSVAPTVLAGFHIYTSYQATSEGVSRVRLLAKFQNLHFWQFF